MISGKQPNITQVPSGIFLNHVEEAYVVNAYADVYVVMAQPDTEIKDKIQEQLKLFDSANSMMRVKFTLHSQKPHGAPDLAPLRQAWTHRQRILSARMDPQVEMPNKRSKRGLFNFIGQLSSSLFGTATQEDVDNLRKCHNQLAGATEHLIDSHNQVISKVNKLQGKQNEIIQQLNIQEERLKVLVNSNIQSFGAVALQIRRNFVALQIESALVDLESMVSLWLEYKQIEKMQQTVCNAKYLYTQIYYHKKC